MAQHVLETKDIKCAHRRVQSIRNPLLDRRWGLAPGDRRRVGTNQPVIGLQHLGPRDAELNPLQVAGRQNRIGPAFADRDHARVDHRIE